MKNPGLPRREAPSRHKKNKAMCIACQKDGRFPQKQRAYISRIESGYSRPAMVKRGPRVEKPPHSDIGARDGRARHV